jgi:CDP-6-deoxy-D-xylo-4-hexulose-3-dehydrase
MGEGGAVLTALPMLRTLLESFRDWGRDCWCLPGCDNTCGKRFDWQLGELPAGFDHKYTYTHVGYNLKATDMQAAVGVAQLKKLDGFVDARRRNFAALRDGLRGMEEFFILPEATACSEPSWFGFPMRFARTRHSRAIRSRGVEDRKIATRLLFGGNLSGSPRIRGANIVWWGICETRTL